MKVNFSCIIASVFFIFFLIRAIDVGNEQIARKKQVPGVRRTRCTAFAYSVELFKVTVVCSTRAQFIPIEQDT